jgi:hypothetical protein
LNANNRVDIRCWPIQSCRHSSLTLVGISIGLKFISGEGI